MGDASRAGGDAPGIFRDPVLMSTAGALGTEKPTAVGKDGTRKRSKHHHHHQHGSRAGKTIRDGRGNVVIPSAPPVYDTAPLTETTNLAGVVDAQIRSSLGVKSRSVKAVGPFHQSQITTESFLQFQVSSRGHSFVKNS